MYTAAIMFNALGFEAVIGMNPVRWNHTHVNEQAKWKQMLFIMYKISPRVLFYWFLMLISIFICRY